LIKNHFSINTDFLPCSIDFWKKSSINQESKYRIGEEHPNLALNLFPHPLPLSQRWERGDIILVKRIPSLGFGVKG
jgi:hypothetical protein